MGELFCPNCLSAIDAARPRCGGCDFTRPPGGWPTQEYLGQTIGGKYQVERKLGEGGFGVVLLARQKKGDHDLGYVVLKILHAHLASKPSVRRRFINEARAARSLTSQNVVKVFDFDFDERGNPYLVMEYLEGEPLHTKIKRGPLEPGRVIQIGVQIAGALQQCHAAEILHRDLTPKNILLLPGQRGDFVKVIDFGIAYLPGGTRSETMLGTPKYMAPEQIRQGPTDERVDIFALGVLLFEAFSGKTPIIAARSADYLQANLERAPRPLRSVVPGLPEALETLLGSMMAKEPDARPRSMAEVEARLIAIGEGEGWLARSPSGALDDETLSLSPATRATAPAEGPATASSGVAATTLDNQPAGARPLATAAPPPGRTGSARRWLLLLVGSALIAALVWSAARMVPDRGSGPQGEGLDLIQIRGEPAAIASGVDAARGGAVSDAAGSPERSPTDAAAAQEASPSPRVVPSGKKRSRSRRSMKRPRTRRVTPAGKRSPGTKKTGARGRNSPGSESAGDNDFVKVPGGL